MNVGLHMQVIDIKHWLNEQQDGPAAPQLRLKVKKLTEIITWITSRDRGLPAGEAPKGWRRPKRKACKGTLYNVELLQQQSQNVV